MENPLKNGSIMKTLFASLLSMTFLFFFCDHATLDPAGNLPPQNTPPTKPVILSPANGSTKLDTRVQVSWTSTDYDEDTLRYLLVTGVYPDTNKPISSALILRDTFQTFGGLSYGKTYFVRIGATDRKDTVWSDMTVFSTKTPQDRFIGMWALLKVQISGLIDTTMAYQSPMTIIDFRDSYVNSYSDQSTCYNENKSYYHLTGNTLMVTDTTQQPATDTLTFVFSGDTLVLSMAASGFSAKEYFYRYTGPVPHPSWPQNRCVAALPKKARMGF
jgi:hypothetical protein